MGFTSIEGRKREESGGEAMKMFFWTGTRPVQLNTTMASLLLTVKLNFLQLQTIPPSNSMKKVGLKPAFCSAVQRVELQEEKVGILCEPCSGTGWLLCDFCNGQKTNVKSNTNRIYRRCPTCKAVRHKKHEICVTTISKNSDMLATWLLTHVVEFYQQTEVSHILDTRDILKPLLGTTVS
ncbi:hypothetical protein Cgig2_011364 [Carnegiea gigantea]|uniref:Uncharacterized protein n=1 Tax=Carnegiea gigantea TaxID=171969 RepID=A0A9Q1KTR9_9CARY|nr:hypothetical protein Cgig2_011364 [Carnegiea gigantea]